MARAAVMIGGLAALLAAPALAGPSLADPASVARGERLARAVCARCHAIGRSGESPDRMAPPFRGLARFEAGRSLDEVFAEGTLVTHFGMPRIGLTEQDRADLLAYVRVVQRPQ